MTRHFTIRKMLRMTPNTLLRAFFQQAFERLLCIDWRRLPERCDEALMIAIKMLPQETQNKVESTLAEIHELACDAGVQLLLELAKSTGNSEFVSQRPNYGAYYVAMWTWLNYPALFKQAVMMQAIDNLSRWKKRKDLPQIEPRRSADALDELSREIAEFLHREEGRGQFCTVEHYRRANGTDYYVAYPDDFLQSAATHDESGNLRPLLFRQTFEIVFAYNQQEGTLELFAQMQSITKTKLEALFCRVILDAEVSTVQSVRSFDLNRIKDRHFRLETDPEDGMTATLTGLRLKFAPYGNIDLDAKGSDRTRDVFAMATCCLNDETASLDKLEVVKARFRFQFGSAPGCRPETLDFDVTGPNYCTVRSRRPDRVDLVRKYLKRWSIAHG